MAARLEIYKCEACGNIIEVLDGGDGELVCCDQPMELLEAKTADKTVEKHVPLIEKVDGGVKVVVGCTPHPMTPEHWIQWIELLVDGKAYLQFLDPGDEPEAIFAVDGENLTAREHCNIHGLWKG